MGEAKRRRSAIDQLKKLDEAWHSSLSDSEKVIYQLAVDIDEKLVRGKRFFEGCYHLAFFMSKYLESVGIAVTPVVGWVNDGTWQGVASHAWIEYRDKITDASLTYTKHPEAQPTGGLIILGREVRKGMTTYTYFPHSDETAREKLESIRNDAELHSLVQATEERHKTMLMIAQSRSFDQYLANAPSGYRYEDLCRIVKS